MVRAVLCCAAVAVWHCLCIDERAEGAIRKIRCILFCPWVVVLQVQISLLVCAVFANASTGSQIAAPLEAAELVFCHRTR